MIYISFKYLLTKEWLQHQVIFCDLVLLKSNIGIFYIHIILNYRELLTLGVIFAIIR